MNDDTLAEWLKRHWVEAQKEAGGDDPEVDRFINSEVTSIRYAFFTQLVGKLADPERDLLCLQKQDAAAGKWDPRSFCTKTIVPWVQENQNVLGKSTDPYVNKPLRRPRLDGNMDSLRSRPEWEALVGLLERTQLADDSKSVKRMVVRCLRSIARRLRRQTFEYPVPHRISLDQLVELIVAYLAETSGGLRPQALATALFRVLGDALGLFDQVTGQGLNEADAATGMPGDIVCRDAEGSPVLAVEVKDRTVGLTDLRMAITKARSSSLRNFLFAAPGVVDAESDEVVSMVAEEWSKGINIYHVSLEGLVRNVFVLLDEVWRTRLLTEIGVELDSRSAPLEAREGWRDLLERA